MSTLPLPISSRRGSTALAILARAGMVPCLIVVVAACMVILEPNYLSRLNLFNILRNFSLLLITSIGQMLVMVLGGFDMSVGAVMALASITSALTMSYLSAAFPELGVVYVCLGGVIAGLAAGIVTGTINGVIVVKLRVNPFMATLATMSILSGVALFVTRGVPVGGLPDDFVSVVGRGTFAGVPLIFCIAMVVLGLSWVWTQHTAAGRHVYAVGGNPVAAKASGIVGGRVQIGVYAVCGLLAALTGVLMTARVGWGQPMLGATGAIESIAAAVLGGVSLRGGIGHVGRVAGAALLLAMLSNALNLANIDSKWQTLILGVTVIVGVLIEVKTRNERDGDA